MHLRYPHAHIGIQTSTHSLVALFVSIFMLRLNFYIATIGEQLVELVPGDLGVCVCVFENPCVQGSRCTCLPACLVVCWSRV